MNRLLHTRTLLAYIIASCASSAAIVWLIVTNQMVYLLVALLVFVISVYKIIHLFLDTSRKVSFMFNAIDCDDYTFQFTETTSTTDNLMLNSSLNRIKEIMTNAKIRAMEREKYYELIMNSVRTGIITVNEKGNVYQINDEALKLFQLPVFNHLNQLRHIDPKLSESLTNLKPGERTKLAFNTERGNVSISASASSIYYDGKPLKIISINDINNELDEKQVESWVKLTRVLTHEIMNSLAPITSLSDTLISINPDKGDEIAQGLQTISSTSKSLISFVESYRKFTRLQTPVRSPFALRQMLEQTAALMTKGTKIEVCVEPDDILLYADKDMVMQLFVNLLKNAVQAQSSIPEQDRRIKITASIADDESISIYFTNSGNAIPKEIADDIFMPFFTTKQEGSGIGLSVAKQIMHLHGGTIKLTSNVDNNITFAVMFP